MKFGYLPPKVSDGGNSSATFDKVFPLIQSDGGLVEQAQGNGTRRSATKKKTLKKIEKQTALLVECGFAPSWLRNSGEANDNTKRVIVDDLRDATKGSNYDKNDDTNRHSSVINNALRKVKVSGDGCKVHKLNPFDKEIMSYIKDFGEHECGSSNFSIS